MTTDQKVKIGDIVKFIDKTGVERVGVVYEGGTAFARVETYIGVGKLRDLDVATFQPAAEEDLLEYVDETHSSLTLAAIMMLNDAD